MFRFIFLPIPQANMLNAPQVVLGGFWMTPQPQQLVAVTLWIWILTQDFVV